MCLLLELILFLLVVLVIVILYFSFLVIVIALEDFVIDFVNKYYLYTRWVLNL